jgi:cation diffusion facilitator CzcD-associated flavoprotein CzcO
VDVECGQPGEHYEVVVIGARQAGLATVQFLS